MNQGQSQNQGQGQGQGQIELWESAAEAFNARHSLIDDQHRSLPTPCPDFDVTALVDHAVGTQIGIGQMLGGSAAEGAPWSEARVAMANALADTPNLDETIEHPGLGAVTRGRMLAIATNDLLIHTWDLARAIGADEALPSKNLQAAIDGIEAFPEPVRAALFATPLTATDDSSAQARMLAVAGRQV